MHNADIHFGDDYDVDELVDVIEGSRVYVPAIYVINKIDQVGLGMLLALRLAGVGSCNSTCICLGGGVCIGSCAQATKSVTIYTKSSTQCTVLEITVKEHGGMVSLCAA